MEPELRLEALKIAQAQLPPSTPVETLLEEAERVYQFLLGNLTGSFQQARVKAALSGVGTGSII